eukprot:c25995_g1_i3 orf=92-1255(+)
MAFPHTSMSLRLALPLPFPTSLVWWRNSPPSSVCNTCLKVFALPPRFLYCIGRESCQLWRHSALGGLRMRFTVAGAQERFPLVEFPKNFDFSAEERIYNWWESQGYFKPNLHKEGQPFVVSMPPPNVTGALHMGHAMFVTLEDIMTRYWRMRGRPTLWIPGTDHAGIATQLVVEKMLAAQGLKREELSREEFVEKVWEWKKKFGGTITNQLRRLGASCDWTREHFTLDEQLSEAVVEAFVRLHDKGLVYRGNYMVNWSPNLQTAVSDLEVEYTEEPGTLYYIRYPVAASTSDNFLPVATTRPETIFGDTAIAVHPEDGRYSKYVGKKAIVPMSGGREIPIISDEVITCEEIPFQDISESNWLSVTKTLPSIHFYNLDNHIPFIFLGA